MFVYLWYEAKCFYLIFKYSFNMKVLGTEHRQHDCLFIVISELLEYSGLMLMAMIFRHGPSNNYKITVSFIEWPVNFQIYS